MESPKLHVVIFPSAGLGHLTPFAEFAKRLSECHGLSVTFMTCQWMFSSHLIAAFSECMASASLDITFVQLPGDVEIEGAEHIKTETRISMAMEKSTGLVEMGLRSLFDSGSPVSAFITDFFCSAMFDVTAKLSIPTYVFFTSPASMLPLMFSMPKIVLETPISFKDADFPVKAPGLPPISSRDLPTPLQDRSDEVFSWFVHHFLRLREIKGVLINTFEELETEPIKALVEGNISINATFGHRIPRVYPVGPVISSSPLESRDKLLQDRRVDCLDWLDQQPPSSVLFVSFGSGGALPKAQVTEIALGLEASRHRFLWVLRSASERIFQPSKVESVLNRGQNLSPLLQSSSKALPFFSGTNSFGVPRVGEAQPEERFSCGDSVLDCRLSSLTPTSSATSIDTEFSISKSPPSSEYHSESSSPPPFFRSLRMGDSNVAAAMAFGQCPGPHVCRELSKRSFNFSVQRSASVTVWFMSLICGGLGSAEAIFAGMLTVDVTAPPPSRVAAPRSFTLASRRVRRKTSKVWTSQQHTIWWQRTGNLKSRLLRRDRSSDFSTVGCDTAVCSKLNAYDCQGGDCVYEVHTEPVEPQEIYGRSVELLLEISVDRKQTVFANEFSKRSQIAGLNQPAFVLQNILVELQLFCHQVQNKLAALMMKMDMPLGLPLGEGAGTLSFTTQLGTQTGRRFSYCMVDRASEFSGTLEFRPESVPVEIDSG